MARRCRTVRVNSEVAVHLTGWSLLPCLLPHCTLFSPSVSLSCKSWLRGTKNPTCFAGTSHRVSVPRSPSFRLTLLGSASHSSSPRAPSPGHTLDSLESA